MTVALEACGMNAQAPPRKLEADRETVERFLDLFRHADEDTFVSLRAFDDELDGEKAVFVEPLRLDNPDRVRVDLALGSDVTLSHRGSSARRAHN